MSRAGVAVAALMVVGMLGPAPAAAGPVEDYHAVRADWEADRIITPCRWTEQELANARAVSEGVPDDQYTSFPADVEQELARRRSGGCTEGSPELVRERSPLANVRIARVSGRGGSARELVRVHNGGRTSVSLAGATLRNRRGARVRLPRGLRVRAGRTVTLRVGCRRGARRPAVRGSTAWLCRHRALLSDRGDVARLVDRRGTVVSQKGYGRFRRTPSF